MGNIELKALFQHCTGPHKSPSIAREKDLNPHEQVFPTPTEKLGFKTQWISTPHTHTPLMLDYLLEETAGEVGGVTEPFPSEALKLGSGKVGLLSGLNHDWQRH